MKTLAMIAFLAFLYYALISLGLTAWDAEMDQREAIDRCLAFGGSPTTCMEVQP